MRAPLAVPFAALAGLLAYASPARATNQRGDFAVQLLSESGKALPTFQEGGRSYVLGMRGQRYSLRLRNRSSRRVELVAAVDGRDVISGRQSRLGDRGYVLAPHAELVVDGFRLNSQSVAAFRFGSVQSAYALQSGGDPRDVGAIAVALFAERVPPAEGVEARAPESPTDGQPVPFWHGLWDGAANAGAPAAAVAPPTPSVLKDTGSSRRLAGDPTGKSAGSGALALGHLGSPSGSAGLTARAAPPADKAEPTGLGTSFGERRLSAVSEAPFVREGARPMAVLSLRYDTQAGLEALGIDVEGRLAAAREARVRRDAQPFRASADALVRAPGQVAR